MHHLPLVFFTVFFQAASGVLLCMGLRRLVFNDSQADAMTLRNDEPQMLMWGLLVIGVAASFLHLGKPVNSLNALRGLAHASPLSLEIACAAVFGAACLAYTFFTWKRSGPAARKITLVLAVLAGILFNYAVANVYTLSTVPLWDSVWTLIQFCMSALALGIAGMLYLNARKSAAASGKWRVAALCALVCLVACTLLYTGWCGYEIGTAIFGMPFSALVISRLFLQGICIALLLMAAKKSTSSSTGIYALVFLGILGSELLGRIFFYDLQQVSGMLQMYAS